MNKLKEYIGTFYFKILQVENNSLNFKSTVKINSKKNLVNNTHCSIIEKSMFVNIGTKRSSNMINDNPGTHLRISVNNQNGEGVNSFLIFPENLKTNADVESSKSS